MDKLALFMMYIALNHSVAVIRTACQMVKQLSESCTTPPVKCQSWEPSHNSYWSAV